MAFNVRYNVAFARVVRNKAVYLALGVRRDDTREILGIWIETTEGAKFWMKVHDPGRVGGDGDIEAVKVHLVVAPGLDVEHERDVAPALSGARA